MRSCSKSCILLALVALFVSGCSYRKNYTRRESSVCEIHHHEMEKTVVPIHYGLMAVRPKNVAMEKVSPTAFPHAEDFINPGCEVRRTREAVIYTCPECVRARRTWEADYDAKH